MLRPAKDSRAKRGDAKKDDAKKPTPPDDPRRSAREVRRHEGVRLRRRERQGDARAGEVGHQRRDVGRDRVGLKDGDTVVTGRIARCAI
jgi:hypothetical protein